MKITSNGVSSSSLNPNRPVSGVAPSMPPSVDSPPTSTDVYVPSADWLRLREALSWQPEIREDRVAAVIEKLQAGNFLTPESDMATADAMIAK